MRSDGTVEHLGIIREISDTVVSVSITRNTACGSCRARGSCSISDAGEKTIEVCRTPDENYIVGEEIMVVLEQSLGIKALSLGYILPFFLVLGMLIILTSNGLGEGTSGLISLASLVPYYISLRFFRDRLKKEFSLRLKKN